MEQQPACPVCGKRNQSVPVRVLYFAGIQNQNSASKSDAAIDQSLPESFKQISDQELTALSRRLKPPQSSKSPGLRPIHPDLVVLAFSLFVPFFLIKIYASQPSSVLPLIVLLAGMYGIYIWKRNSTLRSFNIEETRYKEKRNQNQRALQRWMDLHYCKCEDIIFIPKENQVYPVDQMTYFLHLN
jgi:hypothetical protein